MSLRILKRSAPRNYQRQQRGVPIPIPAPSRGMNTLDNYLALPADQARYLENFLPTTGKCTVRPGYSESSEVSGADAVISLLEYRGASGTTLILADDQGKISSAGTDPATELASGYSASHPWSSVNANGYLIAVNGYNTPWTYNGSTVASTTFSGVTQTTLRTVSKVKFGTGDSAIRLWFTVNDSADVWYGAPSAVSGALTQFQLSQIASGGYCSSIFSWKDYTVFVMSTGEVIIYSGDPGTTVSIYGTYRMPPPVGYDAYVEVGGDVILLTEAGPRPMELVAAGLGFDVDSLQGWGKISPSWQDDFDSYGSLAGWNAIYHNGIVYFNVPLDSSSAKQYVNNLNIPGGAWCVYTGLNACQFAQTGDGLFYGDKSAGSVHQHTGVSDDGDEIIAIGRQGFTFPSRGRFAQQYTLARLNYDTTGIAYSTIHVDTDFQDRDFSTNYAPLSLTGGSGAWGAAWGVAWGTAAVVQLRWQKTSGYGRAVAPAVRVRTTASFSWYATDIVAMKGGML